MRDMQRAKTSNLIKNFICGLSLQMSQVLKVTRILEAVSYQRSASASAQLLIADC
jgi:hypothetical protein